MDKLYEELDDVKAEVEKLKVELSCKAELWESLKRSQIVQNGELREARCEVEKLDQELHRKAEEAFEAKKMFEDLKMRLNEKESLVKTLSAANDKLRLDCDKRIKNWEDEHRGFLLALEEANEKARNQEEEIILLREKIERLKGCLSISEKKCLEAKKQAETLKGLREKDDIYEKLEDERIKIEDQLKWKKEQFKHLEEANDRLRTQFRASKEEWEKEKSTLFDEISLLQTKLDSQIRISEDLQYQLRLSNQALAHEESRRKHLEVQVSDLKSRYESSFTECQDAKLQLEYLSSQQDKDIADLRHSLKTRDAYYKELKYQTAKLEQENQELRGSLKELQEAMIKESGASSSMSKLRNKLRCLEQIHKACAENIQAKEAEWNQEHEKLTSELNCCRDDSRRKTAALEQLKRELESCHESNIEFMLKNEEMSIMLLVLRFGISRGQLRLPDKEREEEISELMDQLAMKDALLNRIERDNVRESERAADLTSKIEELVSSNETLREKALQVESDYKEILREVSDALDRTNIELNESVCEGKELEFELQTWKSIAERLMNDLEENKAMRKELETSLLAQIDAGEMTESISSDKVISSSEHEKIIREKDMILEELNEEIGLLEQESFRREVECLVITQRRLENTFKHEKENLVKLAEEKNMRLDAITKQLKSREEHFKCSMVSFSSQLTEKQVELNLVHEAWEKIKAAEILAVLEIEEKKLMIMELEDDIHDLLEKLKLQEEACCHSEQHALKIEAELKAKQSELKSLSNQLGSNVESSDSLLQRLQIENRNLVEDFTKLSTERGQLYDFIMDLDDKICQLCTSDAQSLNNLTRMVQSFENGYPEVDLNKNQEEFLVKENVYKHPPSGMKKSEVNLDTTRSPFQELNS